MSVENKKVKKQELARILNIPSSTVSYYTSIGLLDTVDTTPGGYNLYSLQDCIKRYHKIKELKNKRFTIAEILEEVMKEKLNLNHSTL